MLTILYELKQFDEDCSFSSRLKNSFGSSTIHQKMTLGPPQKLLLLCQTDPKCKIRTMPERHRRHPTFELASHREVDLGPGKEGCSPGRAQKIVLEQVFNLDHQEP